MVAPPGSLPARPCICRKRARAASAPALAPHRNEIDVPATRLTNLWRFLWPVLPPLLLCGMVILILREPVGWWLHGEQKFDEDALIEWVREARPDKTLPERVREYLELSRKVRKLTEEAG